MRKPITQRIAELEQRKKSLMARLSRQERSFDTRRKILLGSLVLHSLEHSDDHQRQRLEDWLQAELPGFVTRDSDCELLSDILNPSASRSTNSKG